MRIYILFFFCLNFTGVWGQETGKQMLRGVFFGYSTQQTAPFNLPDYQLTQAHVLGQIVVKKYVYKKINIEFMAEAGYYYGQHQLINKWFTSTEEFSHFTESFHQKMLQKKAIHQVVLHGAVEVAHFINPKTQLFGYAAVGPMWTSKLTERLAKGFAFSDNIGIGIKLKMTKNMWLSNLIVIRHESNANLQFPNSGHNTLGLRVGLVFNLTAPQKTAMQSLAPSRL